MDVSANVFNKLSMLSAKKWDSVKFATYKKYNLFYGVKRGFTWWSGYYRHLTQLSFILYNSNRTVDCCCKSLIIYINLVRDIMLYRVKTNFCTQDN